MNYQNKIIQIKFLHFFFISDTELDNYCLNILNQMNQILTKLFPNMDMKITSVTYNVTCKSESFGMQGAYYYEVFIFPDFFLNNNVFS